MERQYFFSDSETNYCYLVLRFVMTARYKNHTFLGLWPSGPWPGGRTHILLVANPPTPVTFYILIYERSENDKDCGEGGARGALVSPPPPHTHFFSKIIRRKNKNIKVTEVSFYSFW